MLPVLETDRLLLRPFSPTDIEALHQLWNDHEMRRYLWSGEEVSFGEAAEIVDQIVRLMEHADLGMWCILRRQSQSELIGFTGLRLISGTAETELLYGILPTYWRQGLATEASRAVIRFFFQRPDVQRLYAGGDPENARSFPVMQRLGMHPVPDGTVPVPGALYYCINRLDFEKAGS